MPTIFIIDDHATFTSALTRLLSTRAQYTVRSAPTAEEGLLQIQAGGADLALVDISLPGRSGLWLLESLHAIMPELPTLVLSGHASKTYLHQAMDAGAHGYILKEDVPGILEGIQAVLNGGTYVSATLRE